MTKHLNLAVINQSTVLETAEVEHAVEALRHQLSGDWEPWWHVPVQVHVWEEQPPDDHAWLALLDDSDQANALGYHDLTTGMQPVAKVFAKTCLDDGVSWTVCMSHEACELAGDPEINRLALDPDTGRVYAYETADAVEADEDGYEINGVLMSNFVTPAFFVPKDQQKGDQLDFRGLVDEPFQTRPGGYQSFIDLGDLSKGWQQEFGSNARRERNLTQSRHEQRIRSSFNQLRVSKL